MTKTPSWPEYLNRVTEGRSASDISKTTGIGLSVITRWMNGQTKPSVKKLQDLARHFPFPLEEALQIVDEYDPPRASARVGSGDFTVWLSADASRQSVLRHFSDLELSQEFVRRIEEHDSIEESTALPIVATKVGHNVGDLTEDDFTVTPEGPQSGYALAAKRGRKKANQPYAE